jgi:hypothetical protein
MIPSQATHEVRMFYANDVKPPRKPGAVCNHTWHVDESSRDLEIAVAKKIPYVGRVEWRLTNGEWVEA